jgi:hypothetical protein
MMKVDRDNPFCIDTTEGVKPNGIQEACPLGGRDPNLDFTEILFLIGVVETGKLSQPG